MAMVEIGAEHRILLRGRHRAALLADDVGVARENLAEIARGAEFVGDHPHRDAGAALVAGGSVGNRLAAPETAMGEQVVEVARLVADQMREHLALVPARQIRAGRRRRQVELRGVARMLGHVMPSVSEAVMQSIAPRRLTVNRFALTSDCPVIAPAARPRGCDGTVDDHGSQDHVVQQLPAAVEQADQQDQRRDERHRQPEQHPRAWRRA